MKYVFSATLALALLTSAPALAQDIDVMTQNQYLGADLTPVIEAETLAEFIAAAGDALAQAAENNFPERAQALAQLIANRSPDVVGLQEVFNFTFDPDGDGPIPPQNGPPPFVNHLQATLDALNDLGEPYVAVATVQNLNISLPGFPIPGLGTVTVGVTDRDVILVRADLAPYAQPVPFPLACPGFESVDGCNYRAVAQVNSPVGLIKIQRGFVGIDILVDGKLHRIVDTHLEVRRPNGNDNTLFIQALQAAELIGTLRDFPAPTGTNIVVVGDINSAPEDEIIPTPQPPLFPLPPPFDTYIFPPYTQFVAAGYTDAWTLRPGATKGKGHVQGLSCCQFDDLSNHQSNLYERIDVIFTAEVPDKVKKARVAGDRVSDKTPDSDLWPSDHGSVGAELQFE